MAKLPVIRSNHASLISLVIFGGLFMAAGSSFFGFAAAMWVPMLIFMLGVPALCTTLIVAGIVPAVTGLVLMCAAIFRLMGVDAALYMALYLFTPLFLFALLYMKKVDFLKTAAAVILSLSLSQLAVFLILNHQTGGRVFLEAGKAVAGAVEKNELGDQILILLNQMGVLNLSNELSPDALIETLGGYKLTEAARNDLLLSLTALVRINLEVLFPSLLVGHSIQTGLLSVAFSLHQGKISHQKWQMRNTPERQNPPVEQLGMPKLRQWHLPKGWGLKIGILGLGYFMIGAGNTALTFLGQMFYGVFSAVFTIQGLALLNFIQHKKNVRKGWRYALPVVFVMLLPTVLLVMGVFDQATNIRMLRPLPPEAEEMFREEMRRRQDELKNQASEDKDKDNDDDDDNEGGLV